MFRCAKKKINHVKAKDAKISGLKLVLKEKVAGLIVDKIVASLYAKTIGFDIFQRRVSNVATLLATYSVFFVV